MSRGFQLAEKLGKVTSDPKVAYEFLKTIDAKKLIKVGQKFLATPLVSISIFVNNFAMIL